MSFSSAFLDKIKTSVKISDIVSRHVNWDPKKVIYLNKIFGRLVPFIKKKQLHFMWMILKDFTIVLDVKRRVTYSAS